MRVLFWECVLTALLLFSCGASAIGAYLFTDEQSINAFVIKFESSGFNSDGCLRLIISLPGEKDASVFEDEVGSFAGKGVNLEFVKLRRIQFIGKPESAYDLLNNGADLPVDVREYNDRYQAEMCIPIQEIESGYLVRVYAKSGYPSILIYVPISSLSKGFL